MTRVSWSTSNSDLFISLPPKPKFDGPPKTSIDRLPLPISIPEDRSSLKKCSHLGRRTTSGSRKNSVSFRPERTISIGESGVSYLLPGAPFEFQYSYTEIPNVRPLAIRVPQFFPFAEVPKPRPWTGKITRKTSLDKVKKIRLFDCPELPPSKGGDEDRTYLQMRQPFPVRVSVMDKRSREEILGDPLSKEEIDQLIRKYNCRRQVNIGRDGLTHNMLETIHGHWGTRSICKLRCKGVPTVDMDNICHQLEEKTNGKVIYCLKGVIFLFRGRNYDRCTRPRFPRMLWKPTSPIYPNYIQEIPEGLLKEEAEMLRNKGKDLLPICTLGTNNLYDWLVEFVGDAFEEMILVKIDCTKLKPIDYIKLSIKLQDLVPCVLLGYENGEILLWRGRSWKSKFTTPPNHETDSQGDDSSGGDDGVKGEEVWKQMNVMWKHAIETKEAALVVHKK